MKEVISFLHYCLSIPLYVGIGVFCASLVLGILLLFDKFGPKYIANIKILKRQKVDIQKEKQKLFDEKLQFKKSIHEFESQKEKNRAQIEESEKKFDQAQDRINKGNQEITLLKERWEDQDKKMTNDWQMPAVLKVSNFLKSTPRGNIFYDNLKRMKPVLEISKLGTLTNISPITVEYVRKSLEECFGDSEFGIYVLRVYDNRVGLHSNPVVVGWELYQIYGEYELEQKPVRKGTPKKSAPYVYKP